MTPLPPKPFDPLTETIPAGTILYRVHEPSLPDGAVNDGTVPNAGYGSPSRFAFFGDPKVPVLYAADKPEGAVHEGILRDAEPGSFLPGVRWRTKILTVMEATHDLEMVSFHSAGLRRFGLYPGDLTDTDWTHYSSTVQWAEAAWHYGAQGVSYMCRHYNTTKALCMFGDRLGEGALRALPAHEQTRVFSVPRDADWLAGLAHAMKVVIRP